MISTQQTSGSQVGTVVSSSLCTYFMLVSDMTKQKLSTNYADENVLLKDTVAEINVTAYHKDESNGEVLDEAIYCRKTTSSGDTYILPIKSSLQLNATLPHPSLLKTSAVRVGSMLDGRIDLNDRSLKIVREMVIFWMGIEPWVEVRRDDGLCMAWNWISISNPIAQTD
eukprot:scaffold1572_cov162-Skeletonema_dohrnii-CCMP3373.AAC.3